MPENLKLVRIGLYMVLASIALAALAMVLMAAVIGSRSMAMILMLGSLSGYALLACPAVGFIGRVLCLATPAATGARTPLLVSLGIDVVTVGIAVMGSQYTGLLGIVSLVCFLFYLSRLAQHFERTDIATLVREAIWIPLVGFLCMVFSVASYSPISPAPSLIGALVGFVLMLFALLRYVRVLSLLAGELAGR